MLGLKMPPRPPSTSGAGGSRRSSIQSVSSTPHNASATTHPHNYSQQQNLSAVTSRSQRSNNTANNNNNNSVNAAAAAAFNANEVLQRFQASQREFDEQENLKQADRLQQRLLWKEQMERSAALELQIALHKKTLGQLEKTMEQLKRELGGERAQFDADLNAKEAKLAEARQALSKRKERLDRTNGELRDSCCAIARMRAVLVENFVLPKSYAAKPNPEDPFADVRDEDVKCYRIQAPELEKRHRDLVQLYVSGTAADANRALRADPEVTKNSSSGNTNRKNNAKTSNTSQGWKLHEEQDEVSSAAGPTASATVGERDPAALAAKKKKNKTLTEVQTMLLELEKELLAAEQEQPVALSPSPSMKSSRRRKENEGANSL